MYMYIIYIYKHQNMRVKQLAIQPRPYSTQTPESLNSIDTSSSSKRNCLHSTTCTAIT